MYYLIENSTDNQVGNVFPQASCINQKIAHAINFDGFSNLDVSISFQLESKAKLTDVLSQAAISAHGLLVSKKVKELLSNFNIVQHKYYNCLVRDLTGVKHEYFWLHFVDDFTNLINYSQSEFCTTEYGFKEGAIELNSFDDYLTQTKKNGIFWGVRAEKIKLNDEIKNRFDMLTCLPLDMKIYISQNLKDTIEKHFITGIEIENSAGFFA